MAVFTIQYERIIDIRISIASMIFRTVWVRSRCWFRSAGKLTEMEDDCEF